MICPQCGKKHTDESKQETTATPNTCRECLKKNHKTLKIICTVDCAPNGLSRMDAAFILDQFTKILLGRGIAPLDIDFVEPYVWMDVEISKDEVKKLQEQGILQR